MFAFLGTSDYVACNYFLEKENKIEDVRFVQEAIVKLLCLDWTNDDRIVVFLTNEAKVTNWVDNGHKDKKTGKELRREGLKKRLDSLGLKPQIIPIEIPDGKAEKEIWDIFNCILTQINYNDEVIFDVTHAFRSIPLLAMVILNYAKILKNISVKGIYYGAFEALGKINDVENMDIKYRNAPIFHLTIFARLFDWTNAINNFINYGDAKDVSDIAYEEIKPILRDTFGESEEAKNIKNLSKMLKDFTAIIRACRGYDLVNNFEFNFLKELIGKCKTCFIEQLNPLNLLLDKITNEFKDFENKHIYNGYIAVNWCLEHDLIQQGYTILQETMICEIIATSIEKKIIDKCFSCGAALNPNNYTGCDNCSVNLFSDHTIRDLVSQAIRIKFEKINDSNWREPSKSYKDIVKNIVGTLDIDFVKIYNSLTQLRNDLNHAGFVKNPTTSEKLKNNLREFTIKCLKRQE